MAFYIFAIVLLCLLLLAVLPILLAASVYFDLDRKTAILAIKLFGVRILCASLFELNGKLFYSLNGAHSDELQIESKKTHKTPKISRILSTINIKSVKVQLRYGAFDNAFQTALNLAFLNNLLYFIKPRVSGKTEVKTYPVFGNATATLDFKIKISFTLAALLPAVIVKGEQNG